ncbi:hypothetical protein LguiA_017834 [Lonicera macranthoides]
MEYTTFSYLLVVLLIVLIQANASPVAVDLTRVYAAAAKGAVCLDGSPPAYQFDKGNRKGINNWLVHLEGGGWCNSVAKCSGRSNDPTGLGSSNRMVPVGFYGILSNSKKENPNFYNWNRILVRYCDGSSFTGDAVKVYNALLSGCSAGGLASIMHCDKFRTLIATTARVKCLSDGGYFLHGKDVYGGYHFEYATFDQVVGVHGSAKNLPQTCTSKIKPSLCFYPQNVIQHIRTPLFILNSVFDKWQLEYVFALTYLPIVGRAWVKCQNNTADCSSSQLKRLEGLRSEFLNTILTRLGNPSSKGWFIDSCYTHCQSVSGDSWLGRNVTLNHKTISKAVGDWFYDRRVVHLVDQRNSPRLCVHEK